LTRSAPSRTAPPKRRVIKVGAHHRRLRRVGSREVGPFGVGPVEVHADEFDPHQLGIGEPGLVKDAVGEIRPTQGETDHVDPTLAAPP
jgi:hypothetical protein